MDATAIRTSGLTKRYGDFTAVDGLDLEVAFGEVFGLLGPNGAGKTTTILMLLGLTERSDGEAEVLGLDPARHPLEVKRQVGYLPDEVGFYGGLTGRQNLRFTARLNRLPKDLTEERIETLLVRVGLTEAGDNLVETYSRGMRQRLGLADVLIKEPRIVILDEPTAAIDPVGVVELLAVIRALAVDNGVAVLLSSHLLPQVERICDRVGIFVRGRMVEQGTVPELAARMPSKEVLVEVGVDGDPAKTRQALAAIPGVTVRDQNRLDPRIWTIAAEGDRRREVVGTLIGQGLPVFQVNRVGIELDELYQRYFHQAEEAVSDAVARG
ncbi:MAG: ABC transporter ATP-binding protein [Candidatus Limnocylindrales bacterium]